MQALKLIDAAAVPPPFPMCHLLPSARTVEVFLLSKTPHGPHSLPTPAQSTEPTSSCPPDNLQEIHWIAERGPD